jgi:hypothetical protein
MLGVCDPSSVVIDNANVELANPVIAPVVEPTATADVVIAPGPADVVLASCAAREEIVVLENRGSEAIQLTGWVLHDEGRKHEYDLSPIGLRSGERVSILTGEDTAPTSGAVVWKRQNVWNNDGDIAFLINPAGVTIDQQRCED